MEGDTELPKYAILTKQTELKMSISNEVLWEEPSNLKGSSSMGFLPVEAGALVKVFDGSLDSSSEANANANNKKAIVQVLDLVRHYFIYENLYECSTTYLMRVSEKLWPFVISIQQTRRLNFLSNREHCQWLMYLKVNDLISVKGDLFKKHNLRYDCIIRYIGPVQEMHSVGYIFGLELLHLETGHSPQSEEIPFAIKYMQCDPSLSIFTTADWIIPISSDVKKKFSAKQLLNDTIGKVCSVIAPAGSTSNILTSQRKEKKLKAKTPTANFFDEETCTENMSNLKQNINERNLSNMSTYENDDIKESGTNQDKKTTDRHFKTDFHCSDNQKMVPSVGSSGVGNVKNQTQLTCGGANEKQFTTKKYSTILSLDDRDIVVIDNADIRESTKDEDNIIVVNNPITENVDLADILGGNWPKQAGGAATILNQSQNQINVQLATDEGRKLPNSGISNTTSTIKASDVFEMSNLRTNNQNIYERNSKNPATTNFDGECLSTNHKSQEEVLTDFSIGSLVEFTVSDSTEDYFGVVRWIGTPPGASGTLLGIELEEDQTVKTQKTSDGCYNDYRLFQCPEGRAVFVSPQMCAIDRRFLEVENCINGGKLTNGAQNDSKMFGHVDCPPISGAVAPIIVYNIEELEDMCGKFKGIQGHHNSCYLDATLFSMFMFTSVFDSLLYRCADTADITHYTEVQRVLREEIVNPLRKNAFVRADRVMKLRKLLDQLSSVSGLTSEEKDPEEFLNSLLAQIMRAEPFLKLNSGQDSYFYQLFVEKDERLTFPTVQQLFEQSFHASDIKLKEVPSCLIIQMPRFGKNFKMYPRILPSQVLDVTDIIEDSPRQCTVCGKLAEYECRDCFGSLQGGAGLESTAFCQKCLNTVHMHSKRANHTSKKLSIPKDFKVMAEHMSVPRLYMELFAVVCIETSHYVAFVKAGCGPDAPWCFFDSMADRKGEKNGYNIPEVISVRELPLWLSDEGARAINETSANDKVLPEHAKRLFCDAYMCMYQSTDVMMYR